MEVEVEQVEAKVEQGVSIVSPVAPEAEKEEQTEVSEKPDEEKQTEVSEEAKQEIISTEYAKWQKETLTPITQEREELRKQVKDLSTRLEDRTDNTELDILLKADASEMDAVEARKLDEVRRKYTGTINEFKRDSKMVKEAAEIAKGLADEFTPEIAAQMGFNDKTPLGILKAASNAIRSSGIATRRHMAVEKAYGLLMPQDKTFSKQLKSITEELEQAESPEHMERLLKIIVRERSGKEKVFSPDSGRNSGSGIDLSKLSARELLVRGEQKKK